MAKAYLEEKDTLKSLDYLMIPQKTKNILCSKIEVKV